jgi:tRNA threonylcarbamoyladenosine biosynthesis protein TsaE
MTFTIDSLATMHDVARQFLLATHNAQGIFAFYGDMGAGKTTFIKAICEELGIQDIVNSPTFAIINEYTKLDQTPVYHFDFYRLKKKEEAFDLGCEDYFNSGYTCFIEWPELINDLLPVDVIPVKISVKPDGRRVIALGQ